MAEIPHLKSCATCTSRLDSIFCELENPQLGRLNESKTTNHYKRGQTLFYEGNPLTGLFCIAKGKIKVFKSGANGSDVVLQIASPGDILGLRSLLTDQAYSASAEVIEDAEVCFVDRNMIFSLIRENPDLAFNVMNKMGNEVAGYQERLSDLVNKSVRQRLSHLLLSLAKTFGKEDKLGISLDIKLSRAELGAMIGTTPETVIRLLSDFSECGYVELKGKRIFVKNSAELAQEAGLDS